MARSSRAEVGIAAITALVVIGIGVLAAIAVAVVLSILDVVRRTATPADTVLGYAESEQRYADADAHPEAKIIPGSSSIAAVISVIDASAVGAVREVRAGLQSRNSPSTWHGRPSSSVSTSTRPA